jgi:hypothetical protein
MTPCHQDAWCIFSAAMATKQMNNTLPLQSAESIKQRSQNTHHYPIPPAYFYSPPHKWCDQGYRLYRKCYRRCPIYWGVLNIDRTYKCERQPLTSEGPWPARESPGLFADPLRAEKAGKVAFCQPDSAFLLFTPQNCLVPPKSNSLLLPQITLKKRHFSPKVNLLSLRNYFITNTAFPPRGKRPSALHRATTNCCPNWSSLHVSISFYRSR